MTNRCRMPNDECLPVLLPRASPRGGYSGTAQWQTWTQTRLPEAKVGAADRRGPGGGRGAPPVGAVLVLSWAFPFSLGTLEDAAGCAAVHGRPRPGGGHLPVFAGRDESWMIWAVWPDQSRVVQATLAVEGSARFYGHPGVDPLAVLAGGSAGREPMAHRLVRVDAHDAARCGCGEPAAPLADGGSSSPRHFGHSRSSGS